MRQLTFLGTAVGMPRYSNSTAILVEDSHTNLLLDTSGGHNILNAFAAAHKEPEDTQYIFISHYDSDHILGIVPLIRAFSHDPKQRKHRIFCSGPTMKAIEGLFTLTASRQFAKARDHVSFDIVDDGDKRAIGDWDVTFLDLDSGKTPQLGLTISFPDKKKLSFLGDEPLQDHCLQYVENSDVMLHEAFCTSDTVERFKPYEKHHGTAKEAGQNAIKAHAKKLVLFHMEDETLATRKQEYAADVQASGFTGEVFVPVDLDVMEF